MIDHHDGAGAPLDRVSVTGIRARGFHGVLGHEKRDGQEFSCDVHLHLSVVRAGRSDALADAVDYSVVARKAYDVLTGPSLDLVETVTERIAAAVLQDERVRAVLALGANLGDAHATLHQAVLDLAAVAGLTVLESSPVVDSVPVGGPQQDRYLNAVLLVETALAPRALLHACQDVETGHGRTREVRWGPRTLDVDVVSISRPEGGGLALSALDLDLPHPRAAGRRFVLLPWSLVDPQARLLDFDEEERLVVDLLEEALDDEDDVVVRADLPLPFGLPATG